MKRKLYQTPAEFLEENREFLERYEAAAQLNLGNAQAHRDELCHPGLLFGRYEEESGAVLLFGNTAPWNLCLNAAPGDAKAPQAAAELGRYLKETGVSISGVNASRALCDAFFPAYGGSFQLRAGMDIMVLKRLMDPPVVPGILRKADFDDLELLADWCVAFHQDTLGERIGREAGREKMADYLERNAVCLFETPGGVPVSMACLTRQLPHGVCITYVYTSPPYRGRGYCQNTVAAVCREKLREGNDYCTLFVDKANPVSNRAYARIGFEILEANFDYRLEKEKG